jgi:hypothetical protein
VKAANFTFSRRWAKIANLKHSMETDQRGIAADQQAAPDVRAGFAQDGAELIDFNGGSGRIHSRSSLSALRAAYASPRFGKVSISLRVPEADLAMARRQAEQKGLPYQTYIKSLLHETLAEREKRKAG